MHEWPRCYCSIGNSETIALGALSDWLAGAVTMAWPGILLAVCQPYSLTRPSRSALAITLTDDNAIAAAAMTGDSKIPKAG